MTDSQLDSPAGSSATSPLLQLLARARGGDTAARDELFQKCRNYVAIVARTQVESWLQAKVDASDLVQQTLLEAHRGFANFRGETEAEWLAWLRRILAHNATDFIRRYQGTEKRRAKKEIHLDAPVAGQSDMRFPELCDPGESPSQLVMRRERELMLAEAISQLAPDYQEVIILRNLQRLPFEEVGLRMNRTGPAVQMLWMRALKKLQELLHGAE